MEKAAAAAAARVETAAAAAGGGSCHQVAAALFVGLRLSDRIGCWHVQRWRNYLSVASDRDSGCEQSSILCSAPLRRSWQNSRTKGLWRASRTSGTRSHPSSSRWRNGRATKQHTVGRLLPLLRPLPDARSGSLLGRRRTQGNGGDQGTQSDTRQIPASLWLRLRSVLSRTHTLARPYTAAHTRARAHTHTHLHTHTHAYTHIHTYIYVGNSISLYYYNNIGLHRA